VWTVKRHQSDTKFIFKFKFFTVNVVIFELYIDIIITDDEDIGGIRRNIGRFAVVSMPSSER
jgi:hypothetical protein